MRALKIGLVVLAALGLFGAGFLAGIHAQFSAEMTIGNAAQTQLWLDMHVRNRLDHGEIDEAKRLLDVDMNGLLSQVRLVAEKNQDPVAVANRERYLPQLTEMWRRSPPFQTREAGRPDPSDFWYSEWIKLRADNQAYLDGYTARAAKQ